MKSKWIVLIAALWLPFLRGAMCIHETSKDLREKNREKETASRADGHHFAGKGTTSDE